MFRKSFFFSVSNDEHDVDMFICRQTNYEQHYLGQYKDDKVVFHHHHRQLRDYCVFPNLKNKH